jgi:glycosyltransferase involved in cell wall biosynthesis
MNAHRAGSMIDGRAVTGDPELTVVLPCRLSSGINAEMRGAFLRLCLVALDTQTADRDLFEVVIVDDASEVNVAELVDEFASEHPTIRPRVVRNAGPALGVGGAFNLGLAEARGRLVLLTTDDSLLAPDSVLAHLRAQAAAPGPTYVCGVEYHYLYGILFSNIITGALHPAGDLAVRTFGALMGVPDFRRTADILGFTRWTVTPDDVRLSYPELRRRSTIPPTFRDLYDELDSDRPDLRWLCVRMGNHSIGRTDLLRLGGVEATLTGPNSDQDLGLKLERAGIPITLDRSAASVLIEHRRDLRGFANNSGLEYLTQRWPRPDVRQLHQYFGQGFARSITAYRGSLAQP